MASGSILNDRVRSCYGCYIGDDNTKELENADITARLLNTLDALQCNLLKSQAEEFARTISREW